VSTIYCTAVDAYSIIDRGIINTGVLVREANALSVLSTVHSTHLVSSLLEIVSTDEVVFTTRVGWCEANKSRGQSAKDKFAAFLPSVRFTAMSHSHTVPEITIAACLCHYCCLSLSLSLLLPAPVPVPLNRTLSLLPNMLSCSTGGRFAGAKKRALEGAAESGNNTKRRRKCGALT
jgi:hypothetical protein